MAIRFGFYNSSNGDRKYDAEDMGAIFDGIITDGVFDNVEGLFATVPGTGLQVLVKTGRAWFDHTWTINDAVLPLSIDTPDAVLDRYDAVVLETDHTITARKNSIKIVKGVPAANPVWPSLVNTAYIKQHPLAYVKVVHLSSQISASNIDIRVGKSDCPYVTGILTTVSINDLFNAWQADFDAWFDNIQTVISTDTVTNLQRQIDLKLNKADKATSTEVGTGTNDTKYVTPAAIKSQLDSAASTVKDVATGKNINLKSKMDSLYIKQIPYFTFTNIKYPSTLYLDENTFLPVGSSVLYDFSFEKPSTANYYDLIISTVSLFSYASTNEYYRYTTNLDTLTSQNRCFSYLLPNLKDLTYPIICLSTSNVAPSTIQPPRFLIDLRRKKSIALPSTNSSYISYKINMNSNGTNRLNGYRGFPLTNYYVIYSSNNTNANGYDSTNAEYCVYPITDISYWMAPYSATYKFSVRSSATMLGEGNPNELWFMRCNSSVLHIDRVIVGASSATYSEDVLTIDLSATSSKGVMVDVFYNGIVGDWFVLSLARHANTNNATRYYCSKPIMFNYKTLAVDKSANVNANYFNDSGAYSFQWWANTTYDANIIGNAYIKGSRYYALENGAIIKDRGASSAPLILEPLPVATMGSSTITHNTQPFNNMIGPNPAESEFFMAYNRLYKINVSENGNQASLESLSSKVDLGGEGYKQCNRINCVGHIPNSGFFPMGTFSVHQESSWNFAGTYNGRPVETFTMA